MALPDFTETGDLPHGVHAASLREVVEIFGAGAAQRKRMALRVERVYRLAHSTGQLGRFVVFGSFVTAKPEPNDIDVFMLMNDAFDLTELSAEVRILFDHLSAQAQFGASVFWLRRLSALASEENLLTAWQVKRDGSQRGVIEIIGE